MRERGDSASWHRAVVPGVALLLAAGCTPGPRYRVPDLVGPARPPRSDLGELVVYSADDVVDTADADHPCHRRYTIRTADGVALRTVLNQSGPFGQDPEPVQLAAGRYEIDTSATNFGPVRVPVQVEQGETTVLHLDGDQESDPVSEADAVRLPNGTIVGWRAAHSE